MVIKVEKKRGRCPSCAATAEVVCIIIVIVNIIVTLYAMCIHCAAAMMFKRFYIILHAKVLLCAAAVCWPYIESVERITLSIIYV